MVTSFIGPLVGEKAGAGVMFMMFFGFSLTGIFYLYFFMQDTTYVYEQKDGLSQRRWMTLNEKKYVYTPKSLSKVEDNKGNQAIELK